MASLEHKQNPLSFLMIAALLFSIVSISIYPTLANLKKFDTLQSYQAGENTDLEKEERHSCEEENPLLDEELSFYDNDITPIAFYNNFHLKLEAPGSLSINRVFLDTRIMPPKQA